MNGVYRGSGNGGGGGTGSTRRSGETEESATDGWRGQPSRGRKTRCKTHTLAFSWFVFSAAFFVREARVAGRSRAPSARPPFPRFSVLICSLRHLRWPQACEREQVRDIARDRRLDGDRRARDRMREREPPRVQRLSRERAERRLQHGVEDA